MNFEALFFQKVDILAMELVSNEKISEETLLNSKIPKDFLIRYKIVERKSEKKLKNQKMYLINSFKSIGWSDPFPDDDKFVKGSIDDDKFQFSIKEINENIYPKYKY